MHRLYKLNMCTHVHACVYMITLILYMKRKMTFIHLIKCTLIIIVPKVQCFDPVSANCVIMVQWNLIHTGGLDLTGLAAEYSYIDGTSTVIELVTISSLDTTSANVSGLITGFVYTFSITAENSNGSSTVSCQPTPHIIGE